MATEDRKVISRITWGDCILASNFWDESDESMAPVNSAPDFASTDAEEGILSERLVEGRLSLLAKCPQDETWASTFVDSSVACDFLWSYFPQDLVDVAALQKYKYLQYLNLSHNNLTDVTSLGQLPYLVHLDGSHNNLTSLSLFTSPLYLTYLNLSYNSITTMNDISELLAESQIILDEHKNIIIDDEESKKKRRMKRFLRRRQVLEENGETPVDMTSESSDESHYRFFESFKRIDEPKYLMNYYVEVVLDSRQKYVDKHLEKPGFYSLTVFSDEYDRAMSALVQFIDAQVARKDETRESPDIEYRNEIITPKVIDNILGEIATNFFM